MAPATKKNMMPLFLLFFGIDMRSSVSLTSKLPTLMFMASLSESADKPVVAEHPSQFLTLAMSLVLVDPHRY
jgi:hypothetical protein